MKTVENVLNALLFSPKTHEYNYAADAKDRLVIHWVISWLSIKKH